jgi:hypothetical protein
MLEILGFIVLFLVITLALTIFLVIAYAFHIDKNDDYEDEVITYLKTHRKSQEENE